MDLVPVNENAAQILVDILFSTDQTGLLDEKSAEYVAKTFPSILLDITRQLTEQATRSAHELDDPKQVVRQQLKPYLMFNFLLGRCPQVTGLMYCYFENSMFQPLPEKLFAVDEQSKTVVYSHPGFNDDIVKQILLSYLKYLAFNPKWFSVVWNWSELGRILAFHTDPDIKYLAACCLSIITKPSRMQHISFMRGLFPSSNDQLFIDLSIKHRHIFSNAFKPCIEAKKEKADQYVQSLGRSQSGYSYCSESIAKVANILLLKREPTTFLHGKRDHRKELDTVMKNFVPISSLDDTISRIAYSISIGKPVLLRGVSGSGKTSILEYIAAHTNRLNPPDFVKIQIGDQLDSKLLIGSYTCTEIPGQFEWQPGPLTKAMINGSWIVFEDIDSAPADMAQMLHSIIESRTLSSISCCPIKLDNPNPEFRIFFTQRTFNETNTDSLKMGFGFIQKLCDLVEMPKLVDKDLEAILEARYKFGPLTSTIIRLFRTSEDAAKSVSLSRASRTINFRDLFKFCRRLSTRSFICVGGKFSSTDLDYIFQDAVDCFISYFPQKHRDAWAIKLGEVMNLPETDVRRKALDRIPELKEQSDSISVGRVRLTWTGGRSESSVKQRVRLAYTKQTVQLLENLAQSIKYREPVLLVGETGVGKTSAVQYLADLMRSELITINLSQQSDSSDLLGGYKPVDLREIMRPLHDTFEVLFKKTFDEESIQKFMDHVTNLYTKSRESSKWSTYLKLVCHLCSRAFNNRRALSSENLEGWTNLFEKARKLSTKIASENQSSPMALAFSEGSLLRAVRNGQWILLDEVNLAEPEVLQCLIYILDSIERGYLYMHNLNNEDFIEIHDNFRVFACMNPSTDIGKKELSIGTRSRFTEIFLEDVSDKPGIRKIVESYVKTCLSTTQIERIVDFYLEVRTRSGFLSDVSGNSPVYSLRTLCRALSICSMNVCCNMERSLFESLKITFLQQLNDASSFQVLKMMEQIVFDKNTTTKFNNAPNPEPKDSHSYVMVETFWIQKSNMPCVSDPKYILTRSVRRNLQNLSRIISLSQRRLPILIQGKTSVGKTSLIAYLAKLTGNKCYRINNHEHTDLQEYVGRYVLKESGDLVFQEGLLVRALKKGYWIILDELNLAPCDLLEALNRVLDDNRELFIPETRETIKAHSKFILFATQNPPEEYAGRKLLSRAFRNRFIELHFDDIPSDELEEILHKRCEMPPQYSKKIVSVMRQLQCMRRESGCFNGKDSFMTMRDLFRWGERYCVFKRQFPDGKFYDWEAHLAAQGLILLEGRVRTLNEADTIKSVIEKVFKCQLDRTEIYYKERFHSKLFSTSFKHIYFSPEFQRLYVQLSAALCYNEPVLLCGQTGCGKTTACQLYADSRKRQLITYNCHLNTESSDFVGSVRPSRVEDSEDRSRQTFPWVDGPLVEAMKKGSIFLMDEISLADDAVIERLNSVLESSRSITLTEKDGEEIFANSAFRFVATMNPGGDYGKKELSPALRNRFTEIYCHNTTDIEHIRKIIEGSLNPTLLKPKIGPNLLNIMQDFLKEYYIGQSIVSVRDVISWANFLNKTTLPMQPRPLSIQESLLDGASLVFFDQIGTCGHQSHAAIPDEDQVSRLSSVLKKFIVRRFTREPLYSDRIPECVEIDRDLVRFNKFYLHKGPLPIYDSVLKEFVMDAPVVRGNLMKIVRAMQLDRPILLEGDPGAGKTSVVSALARLTGHKLVRINLSEQTDISDLFGSDLPSFEESDDDETPKFCWHDGPMLSAIKESNWILLDEMNLASQSVLEGLNACFDHRGEIFIPELNKRIFVDRSSARIFACQNPYNQGAARKGLPQSFLNRFTSIYIKSHSANDLELIIQNLHRGLSADLVGKLVEFNSQVSHLYAPYGYEFNLRDMLYWCDLMIRHTRDPKFLKNNLRPDKSIQFSYLDRIRSSQHRAEISDIFEKIFGQPVYEPPYRDIKLGESSVVLGRSVLPRKTRLPPHLSDLTILKYQLPFMESLAKAIELNKMPILVGENGIGKRSIVKILAGITGNHLNIIGANNEMDTVELLGSFEQKSIQREIIDLIDTSKKCVSSMLNTVSHEQYTGDWTQVFNHIWSTLYATSIRDLKSTGSEAIGVYKFQLRQMKELIETMLPLGSNIHAEKDCNGLLKKIEHLLDRMSRLGETIYSSGNFEWIDSILVRSIRNGSWLMIENANLLNPATLDRLNSLVEPDGSLTLNEKGAGKFGIETITPHSDFRLILTMNPEHGELSRAMRNRGIEIFMQTRFYFEDFLILLNQNGFEPEKDKACMTYCIMQTSYDAHQKITDEKPEDDGSLLTHFYLNYISTLTHQVRRGMDVEKILSDLLIAYYTHKGFVKADEEHFLVDFITAQMNNYKKEYIVKLEDERYKWRHFRHDLMTFTGCDALPAMLERDHLIFYDDFNINLLLKPDEIIDNMDIVNTSIAVKIFLELASHGDLEYRRGFIREIFLKYPNMTEIVNKHVDILMKEYVPLIDSLLPNSGFLPISELYIDSRQAPETHYYLQAQDLDASLKREAMQNRWLLSLHRIMLSMIVELVEKRTLDIPGNTSLFNLSESVLKGKMNKEDLVRPHAQIAVSLYELLDGMLRAVSNRSFDNQSIAKMLPKLFWLTYFICKLKQGYSRSELVAVCNQIPMLWALTYQKVLEPMIRDCGLADITYKEKRFSSRIKKICEFLEVTITKPSSVEKKYYTKVLNSYASTSKFCESIGREVDKFFTMVLSKYTARSHTVSLGVENHDTQAVSGMIWSQSSYSEAFYNIVNKLIEVESIEKNTNDGTGTMSNHMMVVHEETQNILNDLRANYNNYEEWLKKDLYKYKSSSLNSRRNALDQFSPIWQLKLLQTNLARLEPSLEAPCQVRDVILKLIRNVNGIIMSPRYYSTVMRILDHLNQRDLDDDEESTHKLSKENANIYSTFLVDHLLENVVLDNQVVGWTKLRVTTCDLPAQAPLLPEYSPIQTLVGGYCLDISHLKLNAYVNSSDQLDSIIVYLWRSYLSNKLNSDRDLFDIELAETLMRYRINTDLKTELVGCLDELESCNSSTSYVEVYIKRRLPMFNQLVQLIERKLSGDCITQTIKAVKMIYFGYLNYLEYAPIFTLDPSLRSREKLEVYRAELAHIKLDLHFRNTLFYWKTGENLQLNEIEPDEASLYPFSTRLLVERRYKLEKSINKLRREHINRPKSDDGSLYYEMRKDVEVNVNRYTQTVNALMHDLMDYIHCDNHLKVGKFTNLITKCRMIIRNLERSILRFKSEYALYSDLTTNFLVGLCFVQQGFRCLYARLEQRMQIQNLGFSSSIEQFSTYISRVFSFSNFNLGNLDSVAKKLQFLNNLEKLCPLEESKKMQSILLKTVLMQLRYHITISPSDIKLCIPLVKNIADCFHKAWLERKNYFEEQRKKREDLYQYKASVTTLGNEISYERREFLDICSKFPTYDHIFQSLLSVDLPSTDKENMETEEKVINLNRSVDLSMCIDICKAHFNFIREAGHSLIGQVDSNEPDRIPPQINLTQLLRHEAEVFYTVTRHCNPCLNRNFDSISLECQLLQAVELRRILRQKKTDNQMQQGSLRSSIDILDENIFDIYHHPDSYEALKFQENINKLDSRIAFLRTSKNFDNHPSLMNILKLITKISSFLITDPLMKFITGAHALLERIQEWNQQSIPKEDKIIVESEELVDLIKGWRIIEIESWRNSLHHVKRKYIDSTLCDLWFQLYEYFSNPLDIVRDLLRKQNESNDLEITSENEEQLYQGFAYLIKNFIEDATLGDYQIRLDLVFSFILQARFAGIYEKAKKDEEELELVIDEITVDYDKLTTYVFNVYRQYSGLFAPIRGEVESEEATLLKELNTEIRIVAWQGRNLWEIKNNFRISHRKLNKVMNKYLDYLKSPIPGLRPNSVTQVQSRQDENRTLDSDRMRITLISIQIIINGTSDTASNLSSSLSALVNCSKTVTRVKELYGQLSETVLPKYVDDLVTIEQFVDQNGEAIDTFYSHRVQDVVIEAKDSKESKEAKYKLCRQMYHSKKYCMQSIFTSLRDLGSSFRRGLNSVYLLDKNILSAEPLRGMIQNQSKLVLQSASALVDDTIIRTINQQYRKLLANYMFLITIPDGEDLDQDQKYRVKGYAIDMVADVVRHNKSSANMYRYLIDVQAIATRLEILRKLSQMGSNSSTIRVFDFASVHKTVRQFNDLVGRAYLATIKIEELTKCCRTASESLNTNGTEKASGKVELPNLPSDRDSLMEVILRTDEKCSLLTVDQMDHIDSNLLEVRKSISEISEQLKDMLNHTIKNYLYSDDDLELLDNLHRKFLASFSKILPYQETEPENLGPGTALHALKQLLDEAKTNLQSDLASLRQNSEPSSSDAHPKAELLNLRLHKLVKQLKLSIQSILREEQNKSGEKIPSETEKRKSKPFNKLDSPSVASCFRLDAVAKYASDCFVTLNRTCVGLELGPLVETLTPLLFLYSQTVASYLNIVLSSLNLRLTSANQLIPFFTDLCINGFGLPYKTSDDDMNNTGTAESASSGDNAGFGEGQGDKDVSKKLEYESQLDELKKDDAKDGKEGEDKEETIEAHDDGVEMSTDIDTKAVGPEQANGNDEQKDEHDDDEEDDSIIGLDKELDTVDQDEGGLDEKLWGDEEDPKLGDEDDTDLREAESDPSLKPHIEGTEMQAKDGDLELTEKDDKREIKPTPQKEDEKQDTTNPQEANVGQEEKGIDVDEKEQGDGLEADKVEENVDLDMEDESALALKEAENNKEGSNDQGATDDMDISISEDDNRDDTTSRDDNDKERSDGELGSEDGSDSSTVGESQQDDQTQSSAICDDDIDNKLENIVEYPFDERELTNPIEETIKNLSRHQNTQSTSEEGLQEEILQEPKAMQGRQIGTYTIYDIYNDEFENETNLDDEENPNVESQDQTKAQDSHDKTSQSKQVEPSSAKPMDTDQDSIKNQKEEDHKSNSKRALTELEGEKEREEMPKRQKILSASEDPVKEDTTSKASELNQARHTDKTGQDMPELVDLVSSSDEDAEFVDAESDQIDPSGETKLRQKNDDQKPAEDKVAEGDTETAIELDEQVDVTGDSDAVSKSDQPNESSAEKQDNNTSKLMDDDLHSSISSIESGQLSDAESDSPPGTFRDLKTSYNTNLGLLKFISLRGADSNENKVEEENEQDVDVDGGDQNVKNDTRTVGKKLSLMERIDKELNRDQTASSEHDSVDTYRLTNFWLDCTRQVHHLEHELCQQLQIVLQPTKLAKYKGDYKTGKRLNMRKIISYIASHYRKDKIWLRRTKPSKRTYNIALAVDNSSSMSENNCRQMTYQSLALLAKSLSIIEAGSLSVVSFGEKVKCIHEFGTPYVDAIGAQWLRQLRFNEKRTSYGELLKYSCGAFAEQIGKSSQDTGTGNSVSQLLIILSDGRNISSEEDEVKLYLRKLKSIGVLTLFVIIDDLKRNNGNSIVDVQRAVGLFPNISMVSYMELFPFPFYVLLRQLDSMPSILGDALRQWFELVNLSLN